MLDLHRLYLLVEMKRLGTIVAVAEATSASPSGVTYHLTTLEREAGVKLLEPVGRRLRLTPQAELLAQYAEEILIGVERAEAALAASEGQAVGTLQIAAPQSIMASLVPAAVRRVQDDHPQLRIEAVTLEPRLGLAAAMSGECDIALVDEYPDDPLPQPAGLERSDLVDDEILLAIRRDDRTHDLTTLTNSAFVTEPPGTAGHDWVVKTCRQAGFEPDVRFTTPDPQAQLHLVAQGVAVALIPELSGVRSWREIRTHELQSRPKRKIVTLVRTGSSTRPATSALMDAMRP